MCMCCLCARSLSLSLCRFLPLSHFKNQICKNFISPKSLLWALISCPSMISYGHRNIYFILLPMHCSSDPCNPLTALLLLGHLYCGWRRNCSLDLLLPLWVTLDKFAKRLNCKATPGYFILSNGCIEFWNKGKTRRREEGWSLRDTFKMAEWNKWIYYNNLSSKDEKQTTFIFIYHFF